MNHTVVARISQWVRALRYEDVPDRVIDKARAQILSVLGSIYAGSVVEESGLVGKAVAQWDRARQATVIATGRKQSVHGAVFANTAMSMALDYDDYLFMGHTGHSAVLVPLAVCEALDLSVRDLVVAQIAANEVSGRLGASAVMGPLNGQMFSFIHLLSSSCSAGRLYGLSPSQMDHAIAIALSHPCYPLEPGFFNSGSKLLTAAMPSLQGLYAVELARAGISGPLEVLDHPRGFYKVFSYYPLKGMWSGLGTVWVSDTLSVKMHPGCAYISAALDAVETVLEEIKTTRGDELDPDELASIVVRTSLLGVEMERLSSDYEYSDRITPVNVTFSLRYSIALMLLRKMRDASCLTQRYLSEHEQQIRSIAEKVRVVAARDLNRDLIVTLIQTAGFDRALSGMHLRDLFYVLVQVARNYHPAAWLDSAHAERSVKPLNLPGAVRTGTAARTSLKAALRLIARVARRRGHPYELASQDLEQFVFPFAARVTLELTDGSRYEAEQKIPIGAACGNTYTITSCGQEKFIQEARRILSSEQIDRALSLLQELPSGVSVRKFIPFITPAASST